MLLSNWNWNTLEVTGEGEEEGRRGEEEGRKAGGGDSGRGTEEREKRGTLRVLGDVFIQLQHEHAGDVCTCMWKGRREEGIYDRRRRKKEGNTDGVFVQLKLDHAGGTCTQRTWKGRREEGWILSTEKLTYM